MSEPGGGLDAGAKLLQAGDLEGAKRLFQEALAANPADGRAHGLLGICLARQGDLDGCVRALQEAARLLPQDAVAQYNLAMALVRAQRPAEARAAVDAALALRPDYPQAQALQQQLGAATAAASAPGYNLPPSFGSPPGTAPGGAFTSPQSRDAATSTAWNTPPAGALPNLPGLGSAPGAPDWSSLPPALQTPPPPTAATHYESGPSHSAAAIAGGLGLRLLWGAGWGFIYGQWWTATKLLHMVLGGLLEQKSLPEVILSILVAALLFGCAGAVTGLIIGAISPDPKVGAGIGIAVGLGLMVFQIAYIHSTQYSFLFYMLSGRYLGTRTALRVRGPV